MALFYYARVLKLQINLKVGLIFNKNDLYSNVLEELLNHQGIIYDRIYENNKKEVKYACIIAINESAFELSQNYCIDKEQGILEVNKNDLKKYCNALCGIDDTLYLKDALFEPMVSIYETKLVEKIKQIYHDQGLPFVQKWFWPNFANSCCIITHDIDELNYPPSIKKKNTLELIKYAYYKLIKKRAYGCNIPNIVKEETKRGIKSSFYFLSNYGKYSRDFLKVLEKIKKAGFEIGLYGSLHSFQSPKLLKKETEELEKLTKTKIHGERQHTLNFLVPHTWRYQDEIGLDYDCTFYYDDKFGFRSGICYPYHPFDAFTHKKFNVLEIPTSYMDWTGLSHNLSLYEQKNVFNELKKVVEEYHGCLVLNFHNMYLNEKHYPDIVKIYRSTLDYVKQNNYWIATAEECAEWWRKREKTNIDLRVKNKDLYGNTTDISPLYIELSNRKIKKVEVNKKFSMKIDGD